MVNYPHSDITGDIIGAAFAVHNTLGPGFLENVYESALALELQHRGIPFQRQVEVPITYRNQKVGSHVPDLIVSNKVIVELKAVKELADIHTAVALAYLAATGLPVALLLNFRKQRLEYRRVARSL